MNDWVVNHFIANNLNWFWMTSTHLIRSNRIIDIFTMMGSLSSFHLNGLSWGNIQRVKISVWSSNLLVVLIDSFMSFSYNLFVIVFMIIVLNKYRNVLKWTEIIMHNAYWLTKPALQLLSLHILISILTQLEIDIRRIWRIKWLYISIILKFKVHSILLIINYFFISAQCILHNIVMRLRNMKFRHSMSANNLNSQFNFNNNQIINVIFIEEIKYISYRKHPDFGIWLDFG